MSGECLKVRHFEERSNCVISRSEATRNPCPGHSEGYLRLLTCVRSDRGTFEVTFKNVISRSVLRSVISRSVATRNLSLISK